ncbi:MAG: hypothetical protein ACP5P4_05220 [Steroidobacteraceae bacterium]
MASEQNVGNKNDLVLVGNKLPHGLWAELSPPPREAPDGQVRSPPPAGPRVLLRGSNSLPNSAALDGTMIKVMPRVNMFGQTRVSREFWERWSKQEVAKQWIDKGLIFVVQREADFKAQASEKLPEKTGLEGLSPDAKDDRLKKHQLPGRPETMIEADSEHLRRLQREIIEAPKAADLA